MNNSKIEWTDHTFNPWWGCEKVSAGCKNCYAETLDKRWKGGHWGPGSTRKIQSDKYWQQPLEWDKAAAASGAKAKVFCASMADVIEHHPDDHPELWMERQRLFLLITQTPNLIWQLLTKRPENIMKLIPESWEKGLPSNVWIGTSVENQEAADQRIPHLLQVPARVRFLSCEPLLGHLDLREYMTLTDNNRWGTELSEKRGWGYDDWSGGFAGPGSNTYDPKSGIDWVIAGGESGRGARPMHPDWVRSLRDQCAAAHVAFFFKQWGEWVPDGQEPAFIAGCDVRNVKNMLPDGSEYREGYTRAGALACMKRVGKKAAGRLLDGVDHNAFPDIISLEQQACYSRQHTRL